MASPFGVGGYGLGKGTLDALYSILSSAAGQEPAPAPVPAAEENPAAVDALVGMGLTPEQIDSLLRLSTSPRTTGAHYTTDPGADPQVQAFITALQEAANVGLAEYVDQTGSRWATNPETVAMAQSNLEADRQRRWYEADAKAYSPLQIGLMDAGVQAPDGPGGTRPVAPAAPIVAPAVTQGSRAGGGMTAPLSTYANPAAAASGQTANAAVMASKAYQQYIASNTGSSAEEYRLRQQAAKARGADALKSFYAAITAGKTF